MALKKITLSFPARCAAQLWLNRPRPDMRMDSILKGMEIYVKFGLEFASEWIEKHTDPSGVLNLKEVLHSDVKSITCRIDEAYLKWLRDQLETYKWNEVPLSDGRTAQVAVSTGLQLGIAALGKALSEALAGADVEDRGEE